MSSRYSSFVNFVDWNNFGLLEHSSALKRVLEQAFSLLLAQNLRHHHLMRKTFFYLQQLFVHQSTALLQIKCC